MHGAMCVLVVRRGVCSHFSFSSRAHALQTLAPESLNQCSWCKSLARSFGVFPSISNFRLVVRYLISSSQLMTPFFFNLRVFIKE